MRIEINTKDFKRLSRDLRDISPQLKREFGIAMTTSMGKLEREIKPLTPVDTGDLKRSIVPDYIKPFESAIAPHKDYAIYVHENLRARHRVGGAKFMEKGAEKSESYIIDLFDKAVSRAIKKAVH